MGGMDRDCEYRLKPRSLPMSSCLADTAETHWLPRASRRGACMVLLNVQFAGKDGAGHVIDANFGG